MAIDRSMANPVPADFPRACGGALSGAHPKIAVRLVAGKFVGPATEEEHRARYDACKSLVTQLVEYSRRKRPQLAHLSLSEFMERVRDAVIRKEWGVEHDELAWIMKRVAIELGEGDVDRRAPAPPLDVLVEATTTGARVETVVDRALARLKRTQRDLG